MTAKTNMPISTSKTNMPISTILLIALVLALASVLAGACGQDKAQEKDGKAGGSDKAQEKNAQAASAQGGDKPIYIGSKPKLVFGSSYVGPLTEIFGDVYIGQHDFIASNSVVRAA